MNAFVPHHRFFSFTSFFLLLGILLSQATTSYSQTASAKASPAKPKYVFLFIGDGMGLAHRTAAECYLASKAGETLPVPNNLRLTMNQFPVQSPMTTFSASSFVTDSAASGTAIACGEKTNNKQIGTTPDLKELVTVAEAAHEKGYRVGILSSAPLDHATPAAFYANVKTRYEYAKIAKQLPGSGFEYFAGGGLLGNSKRDPEKEEDFFVQMEKNGIKVTKTFEELDACQPGERVFAYTGTETLPSAINEPDKADYLAKLTKQGIRLLDNPNGFFMMVEGSMIDWAAHANDAGSVVAETLAMDQAVAVAYDFLKKHPNETLILVTADHETGGLTIGAHGVKPEILVKQPYCVNTLREKIKAVEDKPFEAILPIVIEFYGDEKYLSKNDRKRLEEVWNALLAVKNAPDKEAKKKAKEDNRTRYGRSQPNFAAECVKLRDQASGIFFSHGGHTGIPVMTSAIGVGQERFTAPHDNTDIAKKIGQLWDIQLPIVKEKKEEKPSEEKVLQPAA